MKIYSLVFKHSICHGFGDYSTEWVLGCSVLFRSKQAAEAYYETHKLQFYDIPEVTELTLKDE